jgi:DNA-binding transcriptional LysR family regulator
MMKNAHCEAAARAGRSADRPRSCQRAPTEAYLTAGLWGTSLTALGIGELKSGGALHFSQYEQMLQAAISGQGLALGRQLLVGDLIASGALVAPFKQTLVGSRAHFIIESRLSAGKPQVREFAQWLLAETRAADGAS